MTAKKMTALAQQEAEKLLANSGTYAEEESQQLYKSTIQEANRNRDELLKANQVSANKLEVASGKTYGISSRESCEDGDWGNPTLSQTTLYAGVLAKIGAERSKLLSEVKLKTLIESRDLSSFAAQLRETSYQAQIAKVPLPLTSRKLERAFNENLIESYEIIVKNSPKNVTKYLNLNPLRFEVENIKALIKAANANLNPEQKLAKIYLSVEDYLKKRSVIEEAAKAPAVKQVVNALKNTEYSSSLNMGLQNYEENGSTARLDVLLDKVFYEKLYDSYMTTSQKREAACTFLCKHRKRQLHIADASEGKNPKL